jgi:hypothetical protein
VKQLLLKTVATALMVWTTLTGLSLTASAETRHAPQLLELLNGIDVVPNAADLTRAAPDPQAALFAVALDASLNLYPRRRAVSLLSAFPDATSEAYLTLVATAVSNARVRYMAVYTYVRGWAERSPRRVTDYAETVLASPLALDREAAVRGLRWVAGPRALALLKDAERVETDRTTRAAIRRALATRP